ncbi:MULTISPECIES: hypothetical protein [unclassified Aureimonas]|uniref:hypothetical protein n=1 Tax=unclassified Aureimonas TaxID=2615206 RepID=UPI000701998D|nr:MULTISPECIES: hypothetical protein [unclassified Aureimonas]KQT62227.1 hypothetical protein ASG62_23095 [Aureimonas sp. Leaf427]KQT72536.1 hypothetical protein ASG54_18470 [Aureimonas sp. Leaf460]
MKAIWRALGFLFGGLMMSMIIVAILGAFIALFGGMFGLEKLRSLGASLAGGGAAAFFLIILSPLGRVLSFALLAFKSAAREEQKTAKH